MTHAEFLRTLVHSVRETGGEATLAGIRSARPAFHDGGYHDTRAVFFVWAVERLVDAGLSDMGILWHPLVEDQSPLAWWDVARLDSAAASEHFMPSTLALPGEPQPHEPLAALAA